MKTSEMTVEEFKERYKDYKSNWDKFNKFQKILATIDLNIKGLLRADITECPNCHHTTEAMASAVTGFGWAFITKCHRCDHVFTWSEAI